MSTGIDLHLHTRASDGQWTAAGLVVRALEVGIGTLAVTDHDTVAAVPELRAHAAAAGIAAISGVEVTVHWRGRPLHLLAYGDGVSSPESHRLLSEVNDAVDRWVLTCADAMPAGAARDAIRRASSPRTVADLVRAARADHPDVPPRAAAHRVAQLVPTALPGLPVSDVAATMTRLGAIPILAHPLRDGAFTRALDEESLDLLLDEVPNILGIEVDHPRHTPAARTRLANLAVRRAILVTAGSDSHGPARARPPIAWSADRARNFLDRVAPQTSSRREARHGGSQPPSDPPL